MLEERSERGSGEAFTEAAHDATSDENVFHSMQGSAEPAGLVIVSPSAAGKTAAFRWPRRLPSCPHSWLPASPARRESWRRFRVRAVARAIRPVRGFLASTSRTEEETAYCSRRCPGADKRSVARRRRVQTGSGCGRNRERHCFDPTRLSPCWDWTRRPPA